MNFPRAESRWLALGWLLLILLLVALAWRQGPAFDSSILALLPESEQDPLVQRASDRRVERGGYRSGNGTAQQFAARDSIRPNPVGDPGRDDPGHVNNWALPARRTAGPERDQRGGRRRHAGLHLDATVM